MRRAFRTSPGVRVSNRRKLSGESVEHMFIFLAGVLQPATVDFFRRHLETCAKRICRYLHLAARWIKTLLNIHFLYEHLVKYLGI